MNCIKYIISFIFLFNPHINVIDVFPDFIAWILLYSAIRKVRHLSIQMENAANSIVKMAWLSFASFICIFLISNIDSTMVLTITFAVNTMRLIWGIPAIRHLFSGLNELAGLYDGHSIYATSDRSNEEGIAKVEKLTYFFFVSHCFLSTLPEFAELSAHSSNIMSEGHRTLLSFKPLFYLVCLIACAIIGIIWLYVIIPFTNKICKEKTFIDNINNSYKEKIIETGKHRALSISNAYFVLSISGLFLVCIVFDGMDIVPRFIMPLFVFLASITLAKSGYISKSLIAFSALSIIASIASYAFRLTFITNYSYDAIIRSFKAYDFFIITLTIIVIEFLLLLITGFMLLKLTYNVVLNEALIESLQINSDKIQEFNNNQIRIYKSRTIVSFILFVPACISKIFTFIYLGHIPQIWMLEFLLCVLWYLYTYSLHSSIRNGIEKKYF
ncbi:MAG: hypothetical protein E7635_03120 [Ruminococcaceae bacterium]|nr:hypothetical protein [Oscillospiraceae bacterium]